MIVTDVFHIINNIICGDLNKKKTSNLLRHTSMPKITVLKYNFTSSPVQSSRVF